MPPPPQPTIGGGSGHPSGMPLQRRHPLTNTAMNVNYPASAHPHQTHQNQQQQHQEGPKPPPKAPSSPPLPRQNSKTTPPSPPKVISDKTGRLQFDRVGFLGEGGFARVYEVKDQRGSRLACKVVTKASLKTKKAKTKLYAEIKIHRSLEHPNIVHFQECFEDSDNVYMTLELCPSGSLMDMLRRRRRFTEPESRFFMVQLIGACHYMHTHQVIHRDLKLGNLFLDANMNVKVGDFGLAALIENPGERKKTICGTPNYIAPEVLFDTANGHSFEVDTWSVGVILYTLVVGRPPFQTKDVKAIYKRIRDNEYEFPTERVISSAVQHLIQLILTPNPAERPTLHEIVDHTFFTQGPVPAYIPTSAHDAPPDFRHVSKAASDANLKRLRKYSLLDVDFSAAGASAGAAAGVAPSGSLPASGSSNNMSSIAASKSITSSIAQQEKEFQKAVQPGSPISALLSSARQPLVMSTNGSPGGAGPRENPLLRKLQAVKEGGAGGANGVGGLASASPLGRRSVTRGLDGIVEESDNPRAAVEAAPRAGSIRSHRRLNMMDVDGVADPEEAEEMRLRTKELEAQKARIVAQMAPVREEGDELPQDDDEDEEEERRPDPREPERLREQQQTYPTRSLREKERVPSSGDKENVNINPSTVKHGSLKPALKHTTTVTTNAPTPAPTEPLPKLNGFDAAAHTLTLAFEAKAAGRLYPAPPSAALPLPDEKVFIVSWVDYCNKYGMGYALTDGSVGVHFNDSTTVVLSADKVHFDYITSRRSGSIYVRKSYTVEEYPEDLKSKVYLLKHFERYIMDRLYGEYDWTFEDVGRERGMEWVQKYLRMKHVIVFKLSHDVLQFNFYDHSKLILSSSGQLVTHIDKHYKLTRHSLSSIMAASFQPPPPATAPQAELDKAKLNARLLEKVKYCRDVLVSIRTAGERGGVVVGGTLGVGAGPGEEERERAREGVDAAAAAAMEKERMGGLATRASKMSLR
ncbi:Serine/threonine-protein kinase plo1 [Psilocybe cubensis]|uniref:Serine/threonine-protein kinase n=2 Tax=Psilocybe cubensis TaxID=181762 RepID=A0A8H7XVX6_PSICU|nr:Serine/threonine-protein kinase plo1 [Psilocybe cubensis]KAH9478186.1 Serine/threonine-protein kinase plo1 [Psilocybe cubensis]